MQLFTNKFVCVTLTRQNPFLAGGPHITSPVHKEAFCGKLRQKTPNKIHLGT
jgi:hypothetical protein